MSNMNLNKRILRVSQLLSRVAASSVVRDNLWSYLNFDGKMLEQGGPGPTKGVLAQREVGRQFEEIKALGLSVSDKFKLEHDKDHFWGTFYVNYGEPGKKQWLAWMDALDAKLRSAGYKGFIDRNNIPVNKALVAEASGLYDEYIAELGVE